MAGALLLDRPADGVLRLTISNPAKRNALDHAILDAIAATVRELDARCLLITAAGPVFSAGYDIGAIPDQTLERDAEGFEARALQHEIDHLDGLLFLDRVESLEADVFQRKRR